MKTPSLISSFTFSTLMILIPFTSYATNFSELSPSQQGTILEGKSVVVVNEPRGEELGGTAFHYLKGVTPEAAAAVYYNYEAQASYLPGVTESKVLHGENTNNSAIQYKFNPSSIFMTLPQALIPSWLYHWGSIVEYVLEEQVSYDAKQGYTFKWASVCYDEYCQKNVFPTVSPILSGTAHFQAFQGDGTLITYQNVSSFKLFGLGIDQFAQFSPSKRLLQYLTKKSLENIMNGLVGQIDKETNSELQNLLDFQVESLKTAVGNFGN